MDVSRIKRFLIGQPFPTSMELHERLDKFRALAVFASDPISSNAYATEAIMTVLIVLGTGAIQIALPIGLAVAGLVLLVIFSYVQTIIHYPLGGGGYIVAKDNLGRVPSLLTAAALMTDYILTVSVSVSAGVRAITSALPQTRDERVLLALAAIALVTWANLRGVRESGTIFALPTYAFVGGVVLVVLIGLVRLSGIAGTLTPASPQDVPAPGSLFQLAAIWIVLRAFAAGCTALTGIEAISDGVRAFRPPEARNAAITMVVMGATAMSLFVGITFLSTHLRLQPREAESILSQMTRAVAGDGLIYYWVQAFTMLILILAANTAYQDFPRLGSFLARDGFLPRWMQNRGDRLVFSSGILVLALLSSMLVVLFRADEIAMLPLYALGVMLSFTISQASMGRLMSRVAKLQPGETVKTTETVIRHEQGTSWKQALAITGSFVTGIVLIVLVATKFREGAWIVVLTVPLLTTLFLAIRRHYDRVAAALATRDLKLDELTGIGDIVLVPIGDVHRGVLRALTYAKRLSPSVRAVCVVTSPEAKERFQRRWDRFPQVTGDIQLEMIEYDFRDILTPLVDYIQRINNVEFPDQLVTVVIPEFVAEAAWEGLLHNQTANRLKRILQGHKDIVMIDVPYHIMTDQEFQALRQEAGTA